MLLKLYYTLIVPLLSYGCKIWGFYEDRDIERLEINYLKYVVHLLPIYNATATAVRGELGQIPIHLLWKERILKYWSRLCSDDIPIFLKHAVLQQIELYEKNKQCWLKNANCMFNTAGLSELFTYNSWSKELINSVTLRYRDQFTQAWYQALTRESSIRSSGNKLRTNKLFKCNFEQEHYLSVVVVIQHRVALELAAIA